MTQEVLNGSFEKSFRTVYHHHQHKEASSVIAKESHPSAVVDTKHYRRKPIKSIPVKKQDAFFVSNLVDYNNNNNNNNSNNNKHENEETATFQTEVIDIEEECMKAKRAAAQETCKEKHPVKRKKKTSLDQLLSRVVAKKQKAEQVRVIRENNNVIDSEKPPLKQNHHSRGLKENSCAKSETSAFHNERDETVGGKDRPIAVYRESRYDECLTESRHRHSKPCLKSPTRVEKNIDHQYRTLRLLSYGGHRQTPGSPVYDDDDDYYTKQRKINNQFLICSSSPSSSSIKQERSISPKYEFMEEDGGGYEERLTTREDRQQQTSVIRPTARRISPQTRYFYPPPPSTTYFTARLRSPNKPPQSSKIALPSSYATTSAHSSIFSPTSDIPSTSEHSPKSTNNNNNKKEEKVFQSPNKRQLNTTERYSKLSNSQLQRRLVANARERSRVHALSNAFEALRGTIPSYSSDQKLSKLTILRVAINYIDALTQLLAPESADTQRRFDQCVEECTSVLQTEYGRSRK